VKTGNCFQIPATVRIDSKKQKSKIVSDTYLETKLRVEEWCKLENENISVTDFSLDRLDWKLFPGIARG